jgi:cytidyltransferase-like protein
MNILVTMVGDLFHYGHINLLKNIKKKYHDSRIIIGLHTDISVSKYKRIPILTYVERYKIIESCKYVDTIIEFDSEITIDNNYLKNNRIDLVVHAHDNTPEENKKYKQLWENIPNNFERFDYTEGISTTEIINRILERN